MAAVAPTRAARRELLAARHIPYTAQVAANVVATQQGDYVQSWRIAGISFESADDNALNGWHERLNALLRNVASPNVALWTHVIRRREWSYPEAQFPPGFAADLNARYRQRLAGETLMVNELYLSLVYRPQPTVAGSAALRLFGSADPKAARAAQAEAIEACGKLAAQLEAGLAEAEAEPLGLYERNGRLYSRLLEFLGLLVNGERSRWPLVRSPIREVLATSRLLFGTEAMELRTPTATRLAACLGIKEYPTPTAPGLFNRLLTAPFPFVLTQSFTLLAKSSAQALLSRQFHRMTNAGDLAVSQAEALKLALDQLASNEFAMGEHHFSLLIQTEPVAADTDAGSRLKELNGSIALARAWLGDTGMVVAREDLALEAAFWAQLPGNFGFRPRKAPVTTRNFAGLAAWHNFPVGRAHGNHWGEALALLRTAAGSPYYFSLHASDPREADGGSRRDTGHTFICGPTGSGKTVFLGFLVAMLTKSGATQVIFDKDRGLAILVRALGGRYLTLKRGVATGCNPLGLPTTPGNQSFQREWLRRLVARPGRLLTVREEADLEHALNGTWALPPTFRRLSRLIEFLDPTDAEGCAARLARWCECRGGDLAWVFDAPVDVMQDVIGAPPAVVVERGELWIESGSSSDARIVAFDVTEFLDLEEVRGPLTSYLFHLVRQLLDGRRLVVWMDEFAKLLSDPAFEGFAKDGLKTWRKLNGVAAFATQSPSDVLASPIARTVVEQTPTKIFFPNPEAQRAEYMDGFGLTERELELIRTELTPGSRRFLVRQGVSSVVCELDLKGFAYELDVISGRAQSVAEMEELIGKFGEGPDRWLPEFRKAREGKR